MPEFYFCDFIISWDDALLKGSSLVFLLTAHTQGQNIHGSAGVHLKHLLPRVGFLVETVTFHSREILELHNFCRLESSRLDMAG